MRIIPKNNIRKFQAGGAVGADAADDMGSQEQYAQQEPQGQGGGAPQGQAGGQGQDPIVILAQMSMQALQNQDCNMAMQVCQGFIQLVQMAQQQSQAQGAQASEQGEPVFRKGGILTRRIRK